MNPSKARPDYGKDENNNVKKSITFFNYVNNVEAMASFGNTFLYTNIPVTELKSRII